MAYKVAVDSGHGMATPGKRTPPLPENIYIDDLRIKAAADIIHEKEWNKAVAEALMAALGRCGLETVNVSPGTDDVALSARVAAANECGADIYVSEHYNAASGQWWSGGYLVAFVSQYADNKARALGQAILAEQAKVTPWPCNGVVTDVSYGQGNLYVLRHTRMPAVLVESGFMDVWDSAQKMVDPAFVQAVAEAQCKGICSYFGVAYVAPGDAPAAADPTPTPANKGNETVLAWQQAAIQDGFSFPRCGADGLWGNECETVAKVAVVKRRSSYQCRNLTRIVQAAVGVTVDGLCGPNTDKAIRAWQGRNGLAVDGCVGINSWRKLLGV